MSLSKNAYKKRNTPAHIKRIEVWALNEIHEQLKTVSEIVGLSMSEIINQKIREVLIQYREDVPQVSGKTHITQQEYDAYLDGKLTYHDLVNIEKKA